MSCNSKGSAGGKNHRPTKRGGRRYYFVCTCSSECLNGEGYAVEIKDDIAKGHDDNGPYYTLDGINVSVVAEGKHGDTKVAKAEGRGVRARAGGKHEPRKPGEKYDILPRAMVDKIISLTTANNTAQAVHLHLNMEVNKMPGGTDEELAARATAKMKVPTIQQIQDVRNNHKARQSKDMADIVTSADLLKWTEGRTLDISKAKGDELALVTLPRSPNAILSAVSFSAPVHLKWVLDALVSGALKALCLAGDGRMKMCTKHTLLTASQALTRRDVKNPEVLNSTVKPLAWCLAESESTESWMVLVYGLIQGIVIMGKCMVQEKADEGKATELPFTEDDVEEYIIAKIKAGVADFATAFGLGLRAYVVDAVIAQCYPHFPRAFSKHQEKFKTNLTASSVGGHIGYIINRCYTKAQAESTLELVCVGLEANGEPDVAEYLRKEYANKVAFYFSATQRVGVLANNQPTESYHQHGLKATLPADRWSVKRILYEGAQQLVCNIGDIWPREPHLGAVCFGGATAGMLRRSKEFYLRDEPAGAGEAVTYELKSENYLVTTLVGEFDLITLAGLKLPGARKFEHLWPESEGRDPKNLIMFINRFPVGKDEVHDDGEVRACGERDGQGGKTKAKVKRGHVPNEDGDPELILGEHSFRRVSREPVDFDRIKYTVEGWLGDVTVEEETKKASLTDQLREIEYYYSSLVGVTIVDDSTMDEHHLTYPLWCLGCKIFWKYGVCEHCEIAAAEFQRRRMPRFVGRSRLLEGFEPIKRDRRIGGSAAAKKRRRNGMHVPTVVDTGGQVDEPTSAAGRRRSRRTNALEGE